MGHQGTLDFTGGTAGGSSGLSTRSRTLNSPMDAREKAAREFFAQKSLLPSVEQPIKKADLYHAILLATKWPKKDLADQLIKTIEHSVIIMRKLDEEDMQNEITSAINTNISTALANANINNNMGGQLDQLKNDIRKEMDNMVEKIQKNTDDKLAIILSTPKTHSYADILATPAPTTNLSPALDKQRLRAHIEIKKRQVLLLNEGGAKGIELAEKDDGEVMKLLNSTIEKLGGGEGKKFSTVAKLRNSNHLLTEMSSPEAVSWLRRIDISLQFTLELEDALKIAPRDNEIIMHFVPVSFNTADYELRKFEEDNELPACCVTKARWAKAVQNRKENQKVASLLLYISDPNAANKLISSGAVIANKRVHAVKTIREEMRCFHCQSYGHIAIKCPRLAADANDLPTCGKCAERHPTKECNSENLRCANCKSSGHASNDRNCPEFARKCNALNKRALTNQLPFFPTDDDWTWMEEPNNAPRWRPAPHVITRTKTNQRQAQINDWMHQDPMSNNGWGTQDPPGSQPPPLPTPAPNRQNRGYEHPQLRDL